MPKTSYPYFEVLSMPCARSKACGPPVSSVGKCVVIGRIVRRFQPWEVTARRAGEDQRALQEGALFVRGWVVGVRSVVVSVAGGGATGMRHAHALRGTAGGLVPRSASLRAGLSHQEGGRPAAGGVGDGGLGAWRCVLRSLSRCAPAG